MRINVLKKKGEDRRNTRGEKVTRKKKIQATRHNSQDSRVMLNKAR